jgi:transcriptional regulator with XRE-family HTH domain
VDRAQNGRVAWQVTAYAQRGAALKRERQARGLTIVELSRVSGIGMSTIWRAESGRSNPLPSTKLILAVFLGVDPEELFPETAPARCANRAERNPRGRRKTW